MTGTTGLAWVDCDNHVYESDDCFTRFIEPRFADRAVNVVRDPGNPRGRIHLGDRPLGYMPDKIGDFTPAAGAIYDLGDLDAIRAVEKVHRRDNPAWFDRDARLAVMDDLGIQATILFPTNALQNPTELMDDVEVGFANLRSYNRWLDEEWGFSHRDRLFAAPVLNLADVDLAVAELDSVLDRGARVVNLMSVEPGVGRPALGDPRCAPFWERVHTAGIAVAMHGAPTAYHDLYSPLGRLTPRAETTPFQNLLSNRALLDSLSSLLLSDVFVRFPGLRVVTVESGAWWVGPLLEMLDHCRQGTGRDAPKHTPSELFRRHVYVNPFEYEVGALVPMLGADRICMGSDYPHPEGVGGPDAYRASLDGLPEDQIDLIMGGNTAGLLGIVREARPTPAAARA